VTLIDRRRTHLWKPLLHEIAAGSMDQGSHEVNYLAQAHWHGFTFRLGGLIGIDRARRKVRISRTLDEEGREVLPEREIGYDTLVIAIGSLTNDFGTRGVKAHAIPLETPEQAERFHARLVNACLRANTQAEPVRPGQISVAIIGAGATGTELAAELHKTTRQLVAFGLDRIDPDKDIAIHLIEAAPRILPALPERLSEAAAKLLAGLKVKVHTGRPVTEVTASGVTLADGTVIPAELVVWAAGIKAPDLLKDIAGLETNKLNQLVVRPTLQTARDDAIFAFGDCAACPWLGHKGPGTGPGNGPGNSTVPPRAQAAHQQASHLARELPRRVAGLGVRAWRYRDLGSLVSLGQYSTVGNLMGKLVGGNLFIEGWLAGLMYRSLYKMHQLALHGPTKVALDTLARIITRRTEPVVKLH
jgi:NADH:quinone reductase (non-electrogenic)